MCGIWVVQPVSVEDMWLFETTWDSSWFGIVKRKHSCQGIFIRNEKERIVPPESAAVIPSGEAHLEPFGGHSAKSKGLVFLPSFFHPASALLTFLKMEFRSSPKHWPPYCSTLWKPIRRWSSGYPSLLLHHHKQLPKRLCPKVTGHMMRNPGHWTSPSLYHFLIPAFLSLLTWKQGQRLLHLCPSILAHFPAPGLDRHSVCWTEWMR